MHHFYIRYLYLIYFEQGIIFFFTGFYFRRGLFCVMYRRHLGVLNTCGLLNVGNFGTTFFGFQRGSTQGNFMWGNGTLFFNFYLTLYCGLNGINVFHLQDNVGYRRPTLYLLQRGCFKCSLRNFAIGRGITKVFTSLRQGAFFTFGTRFVDY